MVIISNTGNMIATNDLLNSQHHLDNLPSKTNTMISHHSTKINNQLSLNANGNVLKRLDGINQNNILSNCVKKLNITPMQIDKIHAENISNLLVKNKWKSNYIIKNEMNTIGREQESSSDNRDSESEDNTVLEEQLELYLTNQIQNLRNYVISELQHTSFMILSFYQVQAGLEINYKQMLAVIPFISGIPQISTCYLSSVNAKGGVINSPMPLQMVVGGFLYTSDWLGVKAVLSTNQTIFKTYIIEYKCQVIKAIGLNYDESGNDILNVANANIYVPGFSKIWNY